MSSIVPVITIDGPSGSGKGTVGQLLAQELGWHFLDSGSLYRLFALAAQKHGISLDNEAELAKLASQLDIQFVADTKGLPLRLLLENVDVTEEIRSETCGTIASKIAAFPAVRHALLDCQRAFRKFPGLVTDGRDMGSVVFPDAQLKIFMVASVNERARRRYYQLKERGINVSLDTLCEELMERDRRDQERLVAPLKPAADAVIIDTTSLSVDQVLQQIMEKARSLFTLT